MLRFALPPVLLCLALLGCATPHDPPAACEARPELARHFGSIAGTIVVLDPRNARLLCSDATRASVRYSPASTFKIPNSLIALDTGVATGPDFPLSWNPDVAPRQSWWPEAWARNHTMRTALPNSVVWYYQEIARRVGPERMRAYLARFHYGNRDIGGGIDRFWLTGALRISAIEQVRFLERFYDGGLGVSAQATAALKALLVVEEAPAYRLSGKTGWAGFGEPGAPETGWLVGYLERQGEVYFYATNIEIRSPADAKARLEITKAVLAELRLLPSAAR